MKPRRIPFDLEAVFEDLGYEPHPGQMAVHRSRAERRVLACGARWGKSTAAGVEVVLALLFPAQQSLGWLVAPTYDLCNRTFRAASILVRERLSHRILVLDEKSQRIVLRNLAGGISEVRAKTADNPTSLLGEALDWLVVDEAARLRPEIWESYLSPRLVDRGGWALFLSTPRGASNWLFGLYRKGERGTPGYASWSSPTEVNPHIDEELLRTERERLPGDTFDQEYGAVFLGRQAEPCDECGTPSASARGLLTIDECELARRCGACGDLVDAEGRGARTKWPDGTTMLTVIHHRRVGDVPEIHLFPSRSVADLPVAL